MTLHGIDDLARLAREATQGRWRQGTRGPDGCPIIGCGGVMIAKLAHSTKEPSQAKEAEANAAFIAAASPAVVLGLIERLESMTENMRVLHNQCLAQSKEMALHGESVGSGKLLGVAMCLRDIAGQPALHPPAEKGPNE
jgi:hypothetical protein